MRALVWAWLLVIASGACGSKPAEPARDSSTPVVARQATQERPGLASAAPSTKPESPVAPASQGAARVDLRFLVHTAAGAVLERDSVSARATVLVPHAEAALYDPSLELLWFIDHNRLQLLDLRAPASEPRLIARDMKHMDRLTVMHDRHAVSMRDGCEGPYAVLEWSAKPRVKLFLTETKARVRIDGLEWLKQQLARPARPSAPPRTFFEDKIELPAGLLDCEDEEVCGASVPFGNRNWQLVLVTHRVDGDCAERTCLLRDPQSERFATPPHPTQWSAPNKATPGPCGPYHFDRSGSAYLVDHWLCVGDAPCQDVGGETLGWREHGDVVGE